MAKYLDSNALTKAFQLIKTAIAGKQDTLVSGTNIKTINSTSLLGSGDIQIGGGGGGGISFDDVYPVGSIYMSVSSTDPGTLFGGTWVRLTDTFLLAAGSTYAADDGTHTTATDGAAEVQLTEAETPVHAHTHDFTTPTLSNTAHTHPLHSSAIIAATGTNATTGYASISASSTGSKMVSHGNRSNVSALPGKTWSTAARQTGARTATTRISGGSVNAREYPTGESESSVNAHNNMPPYLTVYMWKRTA